MSAGRTGPRDGPHRSRGPSRGRASGLLEAAVARALPLLIRRSLRGSLAAVWARGAPPPGPAVLAATHRSWWDGYLAWLLRERAGHPASLVVERATLERFRFFRRAGCVPADRPRAALRRLRAGAWLIVFPEGELRPPGPVGAVQPGFAWLARRSGAPVVPLALRVAVRGAQRPEAFVRIGAPIASGGPPEALEAAWREAAEGLERDIDDALRAAPAEGDPPGWDAWLPRAPSLHERLAWLERWWR